jgi:predicted transcriptional regulator
MSAPQSTMTLNMPEREMLALERIAEHHQMSKTAVMRQALRLYQLIDVRLRAGETFSFSGDVERPMMIAAVGLGDPA